MNALKYSLQADSLAEKTHSALVSRTSGMVASQYRMLKLYDESIAYLEKALKTANLLKGKEAPMTKIMVYNELGTIYYEKKDFRKTIETIKEQIKLIRQAERDFPDTGAHIQHTYDIHLRPAFLNLGYAYYDLNQLDSANLYFNNVKELSLSDNRPMPSWQEADLNIKLADIAIKKNDISAAPTFLNQAKALIAGLNHQELAYELDVVFDKYYTAIGDFRKSDSIKAKLISHSATKHQATEEASRFIIRKATIHAAWQNNRSQLLLALLLVALLLIISVIAFFWSKHVKAKANFERIIAMHENPKNQKSAVQDASSRGTITNRVLSTEKEAEYWIN